MSWNVKIITVNFLYRAADYVSVTFEVNGPHVSLLTSVTSAAFSHARIKRQRGGDLHNRIFFFSSCTVLNPWRSINETTEQKSWFNQKSLWQGESLWCFEQVELRFAVSRSRPPNLAVEPEDPSWKAPIRNAFKVDLSGALEGKEEITEARGLSPWTSGSYYHLVHTSGHIADTAVTVVFISLFSEVAVYLVVRHLR